MQDEQTKQLVWESIKHPFRHSFIFFPSIF